MRWQGGWSLLIVSILTATAWGQVRFGLPEEFVQAGDPKKDKDKPGKEKDLVIPEPQPEEIRPIFHPPMIGDPLPYRALALYRVRSTFTPATPFGAVAVTDFYRVQVPQLVRGAIKIGDNESPRPLDRIFVNYNYFHDVTFPIVDGSATATVPTRNGTPVTVRSSTPFTNATFEPAGVHRTTLGLEKTLFDGNASIGFRLPMFQLNQNLNPGSISGAPLGLGSGGGATITGVSNALDNSALGDLSLIFKYALINEPESVLSIGMLITLPTGADTEGSAGDVPHSTLLQPYVGFIHGYDRLYLHGFSSVVVATDEREPTLLYNDIGIGWWLYRAPEPNLLRAIVPTVEGHLTTPLNHRDRRGQFYASDVFAVTGGVHLFLGSRTTVTFGIGVPLTGPHPYDFEATAQLNFRF